jgi:hypothetical protein
MSKVSATTPFDPQPENWWSKGSSRLAQQLCDASQFLRGLRVQMRFGELTRAPLQMLRFQVVGDAVECDWLARSADPWDRDLSHGIGHRHASIQALKDAIDVRALLFYSLPEVESARLRIFRDSSRQSREIIITGYVERKDSSFRSVRSLAMRAKLLGFRFSLDDDILDGVPTEEPLCVGQ